MKHTHMIAIVIAGGLSLSVGAALAKEPHFPMGGPRIDFEMLDTDGNGEITREEVAAMAQTRFSENDTNKDGKLDTAELTAAATRRVEERVSQMIKNLDKDGDGLLTIEEMPHADRGARMFDMIDADDSGTVTKEEFAEIRERMREHRGRHGEMMHQKKN